MPSDRDNGRFSARAFGGPDVRAARRHALGQCLPTDPALASGDSVMGSQANLETVAVSGGVFLGPIARIPTVAAWVCAASPEVEVDVALAGRGELVPYRACVVGHFRVGVAPGLLRKATPLSSAQQSRLRGLGWSREARALLEEVSTTR